MHNRVMHQHVRDNVDLHAAVACMIKFVYGNKKRKIFAKYLQVCDGNAQISNNSISKFKSLMIECVDHPNVGGIETPRMIFGGKHCQSSFDFGR